MIKLFDMEIEQTEDILIKGTGKGDLLLSLAGQGSFFGDKLSGRVLPVGASTTHTLSEGLNIIYAPILLETKDATKIFMQINAYLHLAQELENKLLAGECIFPDAYYYKGTVNFQAGGLKYQWLETKVFVCEGIIHSWKMLQFIVYEF